MSAIVGGYVLGNCMHHMVQDCICADKAQKYCSSYHFIEEINSIASKAFPVSVFYCIIIILITENRLKRTQYFLECRD